MELNSIFRVDFGIFVNEVTILKIKKIYNTINIIKSIEDILDINKQIYTLILLSDDLCSRFSADGEINLYMCKSN